MSDTIQNAIRAAEAFLAETRTPRLPGGSVPSRGDEWLLFHRLQVGSADGNASRLSSNILAATPEEASRARALQAELRALSARAKAQARAYL